MNMRHKETYRPTIFAMRISLFFMAYLSHAFSLANSSQNLISLTKQALSLNAGDAAPSMVYNPDLNRYFAVYTDFDATCATEQKLYGIELDPVTGKVLGEAFAITPCSSDKISDPKVVYNPSLGKYGILYKSASAFSGKIEFMIFDAETHQTGQVITIDSDPLSDPFINNTLVYDPASKTYGAGYHTIISASERSFRIVYIDADSETLTGQATVIDKTKFGAPNNGVSHSKLIANEGNIFTCFELKLNTGTEIWGGFIDPASAGDVFNYFQISPSPSNTDTVYLNPGAVFNANAREILVVYEKSHYQISTAALNEKIRAQRVSSTSGALKAPFNVAVTALPPDGTLKEGAKFPVVTLSPLSDEYLIYFYGKRWINSSSNYYDIYLQRLNTSDLSMINPLSILVEANVGTAISENNSLRDLSIAYNAFHNQYIIGWSRLSSNDAMSQIWRYDNNNPKNLAISNTSQDENKPVGTVFATLSAEDPDPEDATLGFTLVAGTGDQDNGYFSITGNQLKVAKILNFEEASSRSIRVRVTDSHGVSLEKVFALTINDLNEAPSNITLGTPLSVEENAPAGSFTSTITATDEDNGDSHAYQLAPGTGDDNNANFSIANNVLSLNKSLDYESTPLQYVRIKATDAGGLSFEKAFIIEVIDINEPPEALVLDPGDFNENDIASYSLVSVIDPDKNYQYSYSMSAGAGDDDNSAFSLIDNKLKPNAPLDYETKNIYKVRLKAWDGTYEKVEAFIISVIDLNEPPDSIVLPVDSVMDGMGAGYTIDQFITYDQDAGDTHELQLVQGDSNFIIDNNGYLITRQSLIYNPNQPSANYYPISVKATDKGGASLTVDFTIRVVPFRDEEPPMILDFDNNPTFIAETEDSVTFSIKTTDDQKLDTVMFYYRPIRSDMPFMVHENLKINKVNSKLFIVEAPLSSGIMDEMGIEYYFKVTDAAYNADSTATGYAYRSFTSQNFSPVNGIFDGSIQSYIIISNPYLIESTKVSKIFADYGSSGKKSWRLFEYSNNAYREIGTATGSVVAQGKGYWFNKVASLDLPITFDNPTVPQNNRNDEFVMRLQKGWNLIGNPYPFEVSWPEVLSYNGLNSGELTAVYKYKNGSYQTGDSRLKVFEGGFVFANESITIKIPIVRGYGAGGRIAKTETRDKGWMVDMTLDNGILKNTIAGFGMHADASDSYDRYDLPVLPAFMNYTDISFAHPEHFAEKFARDIVTLKDNNIWEFMAESNMRPGKTTLSWNNVRLPDHDKMLILYDINANKAIDMTVNKSFAFTLDRQRGFKILYGNRAFVENELNNIVAKSLPAYPNPFSDHVSIPISLPYSTGTYQVEWEIFDLLGNRVYNQKLSNIDYGQIELQWNSDNIQHIKKGMYIYKIKVRNAYMTTNFHGRFIKN